VEEKAEFLKSKFNWLYDDYCKSGSVGLYCGAYHGNIYILPKNLDENTFWREMAEIIAKEHTFDLGDIMDYSESEWEKDSEWLEELKKLCTGKITIEYKMDGWCYSI